MTEIHEAELREYVNKIRDDTTSDVVRGVLKGELVELFDAYEASRAKVAELNVALEKAVSRQLELESSKFTADEVFSERSHMAADHDKTEQRLKQVADGAAQFRTWLHERVAYYEGFEGHIHYRNTLKQFDILLPAVKT